MVFEWFAFQVAPHLTFSLSPRGYLATFFFAALTAALLWRCYADFTRLTASRWVFLAAAILITPILARALILSFEPAGSLSIFTVPLLGLVPTLITALWLGSGPAILVGLSTGLTWALFDTSRITQPFEIAILGSAVAVLVTQRYRGRVESWLRHPIVAMPLAGLVVGWPLQLAAIFLLDPAPALASLDRTLTSFLPTLFAMGAASITAGLLVEVVLTLWPQINPAHGQDLETPPWEQHLSQRVLYSLIPLAFLVIVMLVGTVAVTSYRVATQLVLDQMARDATNAGDGIPFFFQTGRSLAFDLAQHPEILDEEPRQRLLEEELQAMPFFEQLLFFDAEQNLAGAYPRPESSTSVLSLEEAGRLNLALKDGIPAEVTAIGKETTTISFIVPVKSTEAAEPIGVLVGRTTLVSNPTFAPVVNLLQRGLVASGEGLIADSQGRILFYPAHPDLQGGTFTPGKIVEIPSTNGQAYRRLEPNGTRHLIYSQPVTGQSDWSVIMLVPNEASLSLMVQIALPALLLVLLIVAAITLLLVTLMRRVTMPLEELLQAADLIAEGELEHSAQVMGEDEAGRLGRAFESMRVSLKNRLDEQERLLRVSRGVSGSLELFRAMPTILSSALEVAQARGVRIVLRTSPHEPLQVYISGEAAAAMATLDAQLIDLVEQQGTVVISQVWRASGSLDITALPPYIRAIVALPLRSDTTFHGILWLGYDHEHVFEQSEMTFLSTLASQAAIAISNARLFTEAEEGRRKLEAVLASTADGMIVTDNQGRIVLVNPAAEQYFGIRSDHARGHKATEIINVPELAALLTNLEEPVASLEFPNGRNKILLANTSTIVSNDGAIAGRVAVLRDITAIKELDNIKTVFLRMVSHDLRSPLTYMRGYLSMLPMTGELNERQQDSVSKIGSGIEHISEMTERLLYLSRLQFGDEAELEFSLVDVREMIEEIVQEQSKMANEKNITVTVDASDKLPLLLVDAMLYRQAVMNLISNALKCTPNDGQVTVRAFQEDADHITTTVTDNGIGIREEDQAKLFEAFYRVPQREGDPPRPRGTGLGLVLVKAIAEAHSGSVAVQSKLNEGSTFRITFPLRRAEEL